MRWVPYPLSGKQRKAADRVGGLLLWLPWPDGLALGPPVESGESRASTREEHAVAEAIVGASCRTMDLVPVRSVAGRPMRPYELPRVERDQHLGVIIIGRRWVHAGGRPNPAIAWAAVGNIPREA